MIAAEEGLRIAEGIGDGFVARQCRMALAWAQMFGSDLPGAVARLGEVVEDCEAAHDAMYSTYASAMRSFTLAYTGDVAGARAAADAVHQSVSELFEYREGFAYTAFGMAHLAAGDASAAWEAFETARQLPAWTTKRPRPITGRRWPRWHVVISWPLVAGLTTSWR